MLKKRIKSVAIVTILILVLFTFTGCGDTDHNDGKCDICGKTATYSSSREEYCDKHLKSAVKWYIEKSND